MNSGNQSNIIVPLALVSVIGVAAYLLISRGSNAQSSTTSQPTSTGDEVMSSIDMTLQGVGMFLSSFGSGLMDAYNNLKEFILRWAPQMQGTLDFLGDAFQALVDNVLNVASEACVYTLRYGIRIPYDVLREFLGPIIDEIGVAAIKIFRELAKSMPSLSELFNALADLAASTVGVDAMTYAG